MQILDKIGQKLSIQVKIYLALFSIVLVFIVISTIAMLKMNSTIKSEAARTNLLNIDRTIANYQIEHLKWINNIALNLFDENQTLNIESDPKKCKLGIWLESHQTDSVSASIPELSEGISKLKVAHNDLHISVQKVNALLQQNQRDKAQKLFNEQTEAIFKKAAGEFKNIRTILAITQDKNKFKNEAQVAIRIMFTGMLITVGFAFIMAFIFSNQITHPLNEIKTHAKYMANGDFSRTFPTNRKDEFGDVYIELNTMIFQLQNVIEGIKDNVNHFVNAGDKISLSAQNISDKVITQATTSFELSEAMNKITENIEKNALNAGETEETAFAASMNAKSGNEDMKQAAELLKNIAKKTVVISDIAFQTNILSLNAAIESARAGKHGKSFSVVAGEVGNLAEKSQLSAEEIEALSGNSTEIADKAIEALNHLINDINKTYELVTNISTATQEQRKNSERINVSISKLNKITQTNAQNAEALADEAQQMAQHAGMLKEMITFFKLS